MIFYSFIIPPIIIYIYLNVQFCLSIGFHRYQLLHVAVTIFALYLAGAFHVIDTGHIGVYKRGGAMLDNWSEPGLHFMMPFITKYHQVQVTLQTDQVRDIPVSHSLYSVVQVVELSLSLIKLKWSIA
jgi:regulator of protease activity HflC (stomatin/prohibitin superfamily)